MQILYDNFTNICWKGSPESFFGCVFWLSLICSKKPLKQHIWIHLAILFGSVLACPTGEATKVKSTCQSSDQAQVPQDLQGQEAWRHLTTHRLQDRLAAGMCLCGLRRLHGNLRPRLHVSFVVSSLPPRCLFLSASRKTLIKWPGAFPDK